MSGKKPISEFVQVIADATNTPIVVASIISDYADTLCTKFDKFYNKSDKTEPSEKFIDAVCKLRDSESKDTTIAILDSYFDDHDHMPSKTKPFSIKEMDKKVSKGF